MHKKFVIAVLLFTLLGAAAWFYFSPSEEQEDALVLYGNVDIRQVSLAFKVGFSDSERIAEMRVEEGDSVTAGQVLAVLDRTTLKLQIDQVAAQIVEQEQNVLRMHNGSRPEEIKQAKAQVDAARAQLKLADSQLKRLQHIRAASQAGRAVSQQDIDIATANLAMDRAQLEERQQGLTLANIGPRQEDIGVAEAKLQSARAQLALLEHYLDETQLRAPQDAVVRSRLLEPGDMASSQKAVYALAITHPKWIRVYINETQLGFVRPGMQATISTDSDPDMTIPGQIGFISDVAEFTPKTVQTTDLRTALVYEMRVIVDDQQNRLRLGMPATVRIPLKQPAQ